MNCPLAAASLSDFWGKRWNAGFRYIVFGLIFIRLAKRFGVTSAAIATFVMSGLIHELVITIPAGGGYGLPTLYFTLQGAAMLAERSRIGPPCFSMAQARFFQISGRGKSNNAPFFRA